MIRCEKCSTLYELDDALLAAEGSPVQCTRCQHVFTARPGTVDAGAAAPPPSPAVADTPPAVADAEVPRAPAPPPRSEGPRSPAGDLPRGPRPGGPAVYRPPVGQGAAPRPSAFTGSTAPALGRNSFGAFESRLRWTRRLKWLAPVLAVAAVAVAAGGWFLLSRHRGASGATPLRAEALALIALDDAASLDRAAAQLEETAARDPRIATAHADRALALFLRAAALADEAEPLVQQAAARSAERERLRREQSPGWEEGERAAAAEAEALAGKARPLEERGRALVAAGAAALVRAAGQRLAVVEIARAEATRAALEGDRARVDHILAATRGGASADPWLALAAAAIDAAAPERAARERGATNLAGLVTRHPELLRARFLLARTDRSLARRAEAIALVDALLAANPRHERALALRAELSRGGPAPAPEPASEAAPAAAPGKPVLLSRKPVSLPAQPAAAPGGPAPAASPAPSVPSASRATSAAAAPVPAAALSDPSGALVAPTLAPAAATVPPQAAPAAAPAAAPVRERSWPASDDDDRHLGGG